MQQDPVLIEYLKYSGGIYPTQQQYQYFQMNYQYYYQQQMYPQPIVYYQQPPPQMQWYSLPQQFYPVQNGIKVDDKFYIKTKEKCENGMECKNTYCQKFHHPGIDQTNLILNK